MERLRRGANSGRGANFTFIAVVGNEVVDEGKDAARFRMSSIPLGEGLDIVISPVAVGEELSEELTEEELLSGGYCAGISTVSGCDASEPEEAESNDMREDTCRLGIVYSNE